MGITQYIKEAYLNLWAYRMRSMLAILGVLVGTAAVVALVSGGELATQHALEQFKTLGTNLLSISIVYDGEASANEQSPFTEKRLEQFINQSKQIEAIAPYAVYYQGMTYNGQDVSQLVIGTTAAFGKIAKLHVLKGRFISFLDENQPLCVIGAGVKQSLLMQAGVFIPLHKKLQIKGEYCTIVGEVAKWQSNYFIYSDVDQAAIMPLGALQVIKPKTRASNIVVRLRKNADIPSAVSEIKQALDGWLSQGYRLHVQSAKQLINSMKKQQQTFTAMLGFIGGISLLVGGIGVMNIMLVSVVERRREIGVRLAIGAKRRDIQFMFLCESVVLTLFGGLLGIIVGVLASAIIADFENWVFTLFVKPPLVGFCVSVMVGIFFGFYPAYRASRMSPIEALRTE